MFNLLACLDFKFILTLILFSPSAASGSEFHKFIKPRIRTAKSWVTTASTKSTNRGCYRDVQSIIHAPQPVRDLEKDGVLASYMLLFCFLIIY